MSNQQANINTDTRQTANKAAEATRAGVEKIVELRQQVAENATTAVQSGMDAAAGSFRRASDQFAKTLGYSGEQGDKLGERSTQNMQAITGCGMLLTQAYQDIAREWYELAQKQAQRNLAGLTALSHCHSLQEVAVLQSDHVRDSLRQMIADGGVIAKRSLKAVDEASKTLAAA